MTSNKGSDRLVGIVGEDVEAELKSGCYKIGKPTFEIKPLHMEDQTVRGFMMLCHSVLVQRPGIIHKCNSTIKTLVGDGATRGVQTEIVSCPKCHTSYIIKTIWDEDKRRPKLRGEVWQPSRSLSRYATFERDNNQNCWVLFNK